MADFVDSTSSSLSAVFNPRCRFAGLSGWTSSWSSGDFRLIDYDGAETDGGAVELNQY